MDTYLTIKQAAQVAHISEPNLYQILRSGKIRSVMTQTGEILVSEQDIRCQPTRDQFAHLDGHGIGLREASEKYGVGHTTIGRWVQRGWIAVIQRGVRGQRMLVDEADVAYRSALYLLDPGRGKRTDKLS